MLALKNKKQLNQYINQQAIRIEKALIYALEYHVTQLQNHAKKEGTYNDITGNLRNSIGGVVLKNGKPVTYKGIENSSSATIFIDSLIPRFPNGYVLLIVAGMEYATYVENRHNLNVLSKTELKMKAELPGILAKLKKKIDENTK